MTQKSETKKYKIRELVKFYVERYNLNTNYTSNSSENVNDGLGTYITAITRILKATKGVYGSLWDVIKWDGEVRQISIEDFEINCFQAWAQYISDNCSQYDKKRLKSDLARCMQYVEDFNWEAKAKEAMADHDRAIEEDNPSDYESDESEPVVLSEDVKFKGYEMMIEAIYDVFYESFNWSLLKEDMKNRHYETHHGAEITPTNLKAISRLSDKISYVGKRKKNL